MLIRPAPGGFDRRSRRVVGLFRARDRAGFVTSFDPRQSVEVLIPGAFRMGAADGDAVAVEVLRSLGPEGPNEGKIVEVLGPLDAPGVQVEVVVRRYGLASAFADETLAAAGKLPAAVPPEEAARRERFDEPPVVTIDGEAGTVEIDTTLHWPELPPGSLRAAHLVLYPEAFDPATLFYAAHNGGDALERHAGECADFLEPGSIGLERQL